MTALPAVSVVIPTCGRPRSLRRGLDALARQTLAADRFEVLVAVDGPCDGTARMLDGFRAPYALRALHRAHRGRAAACNAAIRAAGGGVVVILDDDMEAAPECLARHLAAHDTEARRCVVGAVPVVDPHTPLARHVAGRFERHMQRIGTPGHRFALRDFYTGNASLRRADLLDVGLFDERFTVYGNEDLELSVRLVRAGIALEYRADALAHQRYEKDFPTLAADTIAKGRTAVLLARTHAGTAEHLQLSAYRSGSRAWRAARRALLAASRRSDAVPRAIVLAVRALELSRLRRMHLAYQLALDYFYWLGALAELRAGADGGPRAR